jgi:signal transduction histidine kinase
VLRHASRPTKVVVSLTCYTVANVLMLAIEDDGQPRVGTARASQGLRTMHERAQALRGTLEVGPQPRGGFRVWVQVPF